MVDVVDVIDVTYAEQAPPEDLRPFVRAFWWRTREPEGGAVRVLPDGCADLLIDVGASATSPARVRWIGTMTRARVVAEADAGGSGALFGVRFRPGALASFVRAPLSSVTDVQAAFGALDPRFALPGLTAPTFAASVAQVTDALRRVGPASSPLLRLASALESESGASGKGTGTALRVDALLERTGWSARTVERRFVEALGVSPKQHLRYLRFEKALAATRRGERFADLALAAGYADQAHFSREFSRFAGLSPRDYRRELGAR